LRKLNPEIENRSGIGISKADTVCTQSFELSATNEVL